MVYATFSGKAWHWTCKHCVKKDFAGSLGESGTLESRGFQDMPAVYPYLVVSTTGDVAALGPGSMGTWLLWGRTNVNVGEGSLLRQEVLYILGILAV